MANKQIQQLAVLLVEASKTQQRIIAGYLTHAGVGTISMASNGEQGLQYIKSRRPDVVISCMHFPDMTGADLLNKIRSDDSIKDTPFILVSSETGYAYLEPVRQAGVVSILHKPFHQEQLQRVLCTSLMHLCPEHSAKQHVGPMGDLNTMVVDDSRMSRNLIKRVIENLGINKIVEADNGMRAIELMYEQTFDLIITDYNMPIMDGKELIEHIRHEENHANVPILMVSSESDLKRLAAVRQAGVSAIFDKPFEVDEVRQIIARIL